MNAIRAIHPYPHEGLWVFGGGQRSVISGQLFPRGLPRNGGPGLALKPIPVDSEYREPRMSSRLRGNCYLHMFHRPVK
jgi:hypothetical protein